MIDLIQAQTASQIDDARRLFREYETWLGLDLCFQGFEEELQNLPGKYSMPEGRLLVSYVEDSPAGCIALRKLSDGVCEMKRLFVRDDFRGSGIGLLLVERVIENARTARYRKMRLDTYPPKMGKAVKLYESHGFYPIPPYYQNPHGDVLFMELKL